MIPILQLLLKNAEKNLNMVYKLLSGDEKSAEDNLNKAKEIGGKVIFDDEGVYASSLNVTYFPTILVVDEKSKIELKDQEAMNWLSQSFSLQK